MKIRTSLKKKLFDLLKNNEQKSLTINVTQSGKLQTLVPSINRSAVTQLTLTGCIDARDVSYIRDYFPKLSVLDIQLVRIEAYEGPHGTCKFSVLYPANEMPQNSFYDCYEITHNTTLKSVILPLSLTRIGYSAFLKCTSLKKLHLPHSVVYVDNIALFGCTKLTNKYIPSSLIAIGDALSIDCTILSSVSTNKSSVYESDLRIA